jgi:hypothetical protein
VQVTSQLPVETHVTVLASPTVGAQSFTLVQVYAQSAPHVAPQVLVLMQSIVQSSPHFTSQFGPLEHENEQWSAHVASQSLPKLLHVGAQPVALPQSRLHASPLVHPHELAVHSTVVALLEHAQTTPRAATKTVASQAGVRRERWRCISRSVAPDSSARLRVCEYSPRMAPSLPTRVAAALRARPELALLLAFTVAVAIGSGWGLPGSDSWAPDAISPRSCGLGAIAETYTPGHFHTYPPLHMAILTVLSLPWMAIAASRVGTSLDALEGELIKPLYMTGIEASARVVAALMAIGIVWNAVRLWTRLAGARAGRLAGVVVAANATLVYYAHTGNVDVPYMFWLTCALVELDRVASGEARERHALLFTVAAVLTKDQAAAALWLALPVWLFVVPWFARRDSVVRPSLVKGVLVAVVVYALASGALVNPSGFAKRVAYLVGPASQSWAKYPRNLGGAIALTRDALGELPHLTSWPVALLAVVGISLVVFKSRGLERVRRLLPLVAAVSFTALFTIAARRSEERFLLPQSVLVTPYAAFAIDAAWTAWPRWRSSIAAVAVVSVVLALVGVVSLDATLVTDPRYEAERYLDALPDGTHVEVYGGPIFLPRVPARLGAVRPGVEAVGDRQRIAGITELVDPAMDPRPRHPDVIALATELSDVGSTEPPPPSMPYGLISYRDGKSRALLRGLYDGSLGYERVVEARCSLPWPFECLRIHDAMAGEAWIYRARVPRAELGFVPSDGLLATTRKPIPIDARLVTIGIERGRVNVDGVRVALSEQDALPSMHGALVRAAAGVRARGGDPTTANVVVDARTPFSRVAAVTLATKADVARVRFVVKSLEGVIGTLPAQPLETPAPVCILGVAPEGAPSGAPFEARGGPPSAFACVDGCAPVLAPGLDTPFGDVVVALEAASLAWPGTCVAWEPTR